MVAANLGEYIRVLSCGGELRPGGRQQDSRFPSTSLRAGSPLRFPFLAEGEASVGMTKS
jgi:hypothetical protein